MYRLICQIPAHFCLTKWPWWAPFFQVFIELGMYNFLWKSKLIIWSLVDWKQFDKKTTWWMVSLYHGIKILGQVRILSLILQLLVNNYTGGRNVGCDIAEYLVKWTQEKWACDSHDGAKPLSFQFQVTEDFF